MRIHFSEHGKQALEEAQRCAARLGHPYLGSEHLLLGLIRTENGAAGGLLKEAEVSASEAEEILCQFCPREEGKEEGIREITPRAGRILQRAAQLCAGRSKETGTEWILLALLSDGDSLAMRILGTPTLAAKQEFTDLQATPVWACTALVSADSAGIREAKDGLLDAYQVLTRADLAQLMENMSAYGKG